MRILILLLALSGSAFAQGWASSFSSNTFQSVCPTTSYSSINGGPSSTFDVNCKQVLYAYSGGFVDTKRNRLVMFGGGHGDYPGNEIYALTVSGSTGAFSRLTTPTAIAPDYALCPEAIGSGGTLAPNSRHTSNNNVYIEHADRYFIFGGAVYCGNGYNFADTWVWNPNVGDLTTNGWTQKDPATLGGGSAVPWHQAIISHGNNAAGANHFAISLYDRETDLVYVQWEEQLWSYLYDTNSYTMLATYGNAHTPFWSSGVIDPVRRTMMYIGAHTAETAGIYEIDLKSGTTYSTTDVASSYSGCDGLSTAHYPALNYDPAIDKIVGWPGSGNTVYIMDTIAKTCSPVTISGAPSQGAGSVGIYGRFAYFPSIGKYVIVADHNAAAYSFTLNPTAIHGLGSSTLTCIDKDGDTYGVGCTYPDADDLDATVHTAAEGTTKYTTFTGFLNKLGYNPTRIWYISTTGNDGTCKSGSAPVGIGSPCASWSPINSALAAGDMVLVRGGTYTSLLMTPISGTSGNPIILMSYPGERAVLTTALSGVTILAKSYLIIDGLKFQTSSCLDGGAGSGTSTNNQYKNLEGTDCKWGFASFNGLNDIVISDSAFHDNNGGSEEHGIYIGSRDLTSTNVHIRRNLLYNNNWNGLHMNGRMYNVHVEQNVVYNSDLSGIDLQMGVSRSYIRSNLSFNNSSGSMSIYNYASGQCTAEGVGTGNICAYDQTGNLIENNTFYSTGSQVNGVPNIGQYAVRIANCANSNTGNLGGNTFRNNVMVIPGSSGHYQPFVFFNADPGGSGNCGTQRVDSTTAAYLASTTFANNVFYNNDGTTATGFVGYGIDPSFGYTSKTCVQTASLAAANTNCTNSDPLFTAASPSYYNAPTSFDFRLQASSPAKAAGTTLGAPLFDSSGTAYSLSTPNIGAFEATASGGSTSTGTRISGSVRISGAIIQ